jgi:hypothetical protein
MYSLAVRRSMRVWPSALRTCTALYWPAMRWPPSFCANVLSLLENIM